MVPSARAVAKMIRLAVCVRRPPLGHVRLSPSRMPIAPLVALAVLSGCGSTATTSVPVPSQSATAAPISSDQVAVHVPPRHSRIGVVVLHSASHGPAELVAQGWDTAADRDGFIAIYPTRGSDWNAGLCCGTAAKQNRDDVAWLTRQIAAVKSKYGLSAVYLAGNSNGGMMVERLVSMEPDISDRFAVWAAAPEMTDQGDWQGHGYLFHGADDTTVPLTGGNVVIEGIPSHIKPTTQTGRCLPNAHQVSVTLPRLGHSPPSNWPELAWSALLGAGANPASLKPC